MTESPILFSGPMVRAILEDRKTQTRRVLKPQPVHRDSSVWQFGDFIWSERETRFQVTPGQALAARCPYGQIGDRLWVRESFWGCDAPGYGDQPCVVYDDEWHGKEYRPAEIRPWARRFGRIPSIHMPRDCSRITLEITDVRVERLNGISEADAIAEGIYLFPGEGGGYKAARGEQEHDTAVEAYRHLWDGLNAERGFGWQANPWVWMVEFRRVA